MTSKQLRAALKSGHRVFGTLIASDSPDWPEHVVRIGLDFVFLDTEHIALDRKALSWMCRTYAALGMPPIVRIPSPDPQIARVALDGGAAGIMAPYVETVEQVKALVGAVKLRPMKGSRMSEAIANPAAMEPALAAYLARNNEERILTINIESRPALENLDALLAVEGLDAVLVGPHDLSVSLGAPESYDAPEFDAAVRTVLRKARANGIGAGVFSMLGTQRVIDWAEDGLNFVIHSSDYAAMRDAISADVRVMREAMAHQCNGSPTRALDEGVRQDAGEVRRAMPAAGAARFTSEG